jgi:hypothetical protein
MLLHKKRISEVNHHHHHGLVNIIIIIIIITWQVDSLLGNDREGSSYTTAVTE